MRKTIKRLLSLALCLLLCAGLLPGTVWAAEIVDSGTCGENLTWTLDSEGTLTISGTGEMENYSHPYIPWFWERSSINTIEIRTGVTSIGQEAFCGCINLTSIIIPNSVTSIGGSAFDSCNSLTNVTIPNRMTSIGDYAFSTCRGLTNLTIPNSVTSIGDGAFSGCISLTSVTIPNSVIIIGNNAFSDCSSLTCMSIPDSVTSIGFQAFSDCSNLTTVTIPDSVTSIGYRAFFNTPWLSSLGDFAIINHILLQYQGNETNVIIPNSVTNICGYAFYDCSIMTSVTIPYGVSSIRIGTFSNCYNLTKVTIPNSVTSIDDAAFRNCTSLTNVTIPNSVTSIGYDAFCHCASLANITIPNSVTSIGDEAFSECLSLTSVTIPNGVTNIGKHTFSNCRNLTSVAISYGVTIIGDWAFSNCSSLTSVTIPDSVTSIGYGAFYECSSLTNMTIPNSTTSIDYWAFTGCSSLVYVTIPNSVNSIGGGAFSGCSSLTDIYYTGTEAQWNAIEGSGKPTGDSITIHYNSSNPDNPGPGPDDGDSNHSVYFVPAAITLTVGDEAMPTLFLSDTKGLKAGDLQWSYDASILNLGALKNQYISLTPEEDTEHRYGVMLEAKNTGKTDLTVTLPDGRSAVCHVTVGQKSNQISLSGQRQLHVGDESKIVGKFVFNLLDTNETIIWTTSDPDVVAFSQDGQSQITYTPGQYPERMDQNVFARGHGAATITCRLSRTGASASFEIVSYSKQDSEIIRLANDWMTAYQEYCYAVADVMKKEADCSKPRTTFNSKAEELVSQLAEYGIQIAPSILNLEREEDNKKLKFVCKALLQMLAEDTAAAIAIKNIDVSKIDSIPSQIVQAVLNAFQQSTYRYEEGGSWVEIHTTSFGAARFGWINLKYGKENAIMLGFSTTPAATEQVIRDYMLDLLELSELTAKQAVIEAYKDLQKTLLGNVPTPITDKLIKMGTKKLTEVFIKLGVGDVVTILNNCYNYYGFCKDVITGDFSNLYQFITGSKQISFNDATIQKTAATKVVRAAVSKLESIRKQLEKLVLGQEWSSWTKYLSGFAQKTTLNCPVEFELTSASGDLLGYYLDGELWYDEDAAYIELFGDTKTVYSLEDVSLEISATDAGELNVTVETYVDGQIVKRQNYYDIPLSEETVVEAELSAAQQTAELNAEEPIEANETLTGAELEAAAVSIRCGVDGPEGNLAIGSGSFLPGDPVKLTAIAERNSVFLGWFDEENQMLSTKPVYEFVARNDLTVFGAFQKRIEAENPGILAVVDETGVVLEQLPQRAFTADIVFSLPESVSDHMAVLLSLYDPNGRCLTLWTEELDGSRGDGIYTIQTALPIDENTASFRVFAVDAEQWTPLTECLELTIVA
ncbi:MAG: leucine-rich repeat domain-containing protein [Oscillospiraceae bacterium]|nr:leucine-rich repeat domain-containing protein [Oscillospiraceae bacterium]